MIKKIINIIKNWFTPKEEKDPHLVLYEEVKPQHCSGHTRFRKSCPLCQEIVK
jgi:hypothetical protein|tara:strand:+ start:396 stop:554 length:159 start_codon:yes stop_codon:yes gene_type:complete